MATRAQIDEVREILLAARAKVFDRFVAFVLENEEDLRAGPRNPYDSASATERLNEFKDAFILFGILLSQVEPPPTPTKPCPECLSAVPLKAKRCHACAQPLPVVEAPAKPA